MLGRKKDFPTETNPERQPHSTSSQHGVIILTVLSQFNLDHELPGAVAGMDLFLGKGSGSLSLTGFW